MWPDSAEDADDEDGEASEGPFADPMDDIDAADASGEFDDLSETERETSAMARRGQGVFRSSLLERWGGRCAVTGTTVSEALVASRIKPWAVCTNTERLDAANGLFLVGTLDRLFDFGLISFSNAGGVLISPRITADEFARLGITDSLRLREVFADSIAYLECHRRDCCWSTGEAEAGT